MRKCIAVFLYKKFPYLSSYNGFQDAKYLFYQTSSYLKDCATVMYIKTSKNPLVCLDIKNLKKIKKCSNIKT